MAFAGVVDRVGSVHATVVGRNLDAGRRNGDRLAGPSLLMRSQADERMPGVCSTSGRTPVRSAGFRRRASAPLFAETGHEEFYCGSVVGKKGLTRPSVTASAVLREGQLDDIYQRARDLGRAEEVDIGNPTQVSEQRARFLQSGCTKP